MRECYLEKFNPVLQQESQFEVWPESNPELQYANQELYIAVYMVRAKHKLIKAGNHLITKNDSESSCICCFF